MDGESIYIPRKPGNRRAWGCGTAYKTELRERNCRIRRDYAQRAAVGQLAQQYHLSEKASAGYCAGSKK